MMDSEPAVVQKHHSWKAPCWPRFYHPGPATILSIILILILITLLIRVLSQLLRQRLNHQRCLIPITETPLHDANPTIYTSFPSLKRKPFTPEPSPTATPNGTINSAFQADFEVRQLLYPATAERLPLYNARNPRGSVYNTFQIPAPHCTRLKNSRSMMEFNDGSPLEIGSEKEVKKKSKTLHWHGENRLNTAWAWML